MKKVLVLMGCIAVPTLVFAQGEDRNILLLEKLNVLQQEIQELRGQVEVQAHDLQTLRQQQQTQYGDLEQRVSALAGMEKQQAKAVSNNVADTIDVATMIDPLLEQQRYTAAYEKIRAKQYSGAIQAMQAFVVQYPQGQFAANAHYWLGELYLVENQPEEAIVAFTQVLEQFPQSEKYSHAMLKLGYAYLEGGNTLQAEGMFNEVLSQFPNTNVAILAEQRLHTILSPSDFAVNASSQE